MFSGGRERVHWERIGLKISPKFARKATVTMSFLTHFIPLVSLYTPRKHEKTRGFLIVVGGTEVYQWHEMGH